MHHLIQAQRRQRILGAGPGQEPLGEQEHVAAPVPQRGQLERNHRQPVVEVLPEPLGPDGLP